MRTVPAGGVAVLTRDLPHLRETLDPCGRLVGTRVEIDLAQVAHVAGPAVAAVLEAYDNRCRALWSALAHPQVGQSGQSGQGWVSTRRRLMTHQQVTGKKGRADLLEVYEALIALPGICEVVDYATGPSPAAGAVSEMVSSLGGQVLLADADTLVLTLSIPASYALSPVLGGVPFPGEVSRTLTLTTRQAAWRDRRVRRLSRLDIDVEELWADPDPLARELGEVTTRETLALP